MSLDEELHRALRPVDPGPAFTARVLAAVEAEARGETGGSVHAHATSVGTDGRILEGRGADGRVARPDRAFRRTWARRSWMWPALAASLVGAVAGARWFEDRRDTERGLAARTQLMQALRLTSEKLTVAREVIGER